ncbi:class I SAM-dependent methyltransferase [Halomonas pacifica]|uniref:class I SAM-dependent methyltransferase n=1 Tax=Bisbaumannia pacifica TaxID=77098 RepID=UPI00235968F6|nr:class I SAM-dependent methyltransferase [Halomonas pacifica]MDC8803594.1 class I SAM-dependent methyltransferase [Halomonas pacifica]
MSAETPVCQLLERQEQDHRHWLWVAPPRDAWLSPQETALLSGDVAQSADWRARGGVVHDPFATTSLGEVPGAVLFWPKSHALGEWWLLSLCQRLPEGTPLWLVGENNGGIKRVLKVLAALGLGCRKRDSARRCSLFETQVGRVALDPALVWQRFEAEGLTLHSHPGVFGHGKLDDGTRLLLETLAPRLPEGPFRALDMGCGDGILACWLARRGARVSATDINAFAVEATRRSLAANDLAGEVVAGDVYSGLPEGASFERIISNPPFHQERAIDYGPAGRLIREAPAYLAPGGELWLVANAFLPYPDLLEASFGGFEILADDRRFRVYRAIKR